MNNLRAFKLNDSVAFSFFNISSMLLEEELGSNAIDISTNGISDLNFHIAFTLKGLAVEGSSEESWPDWVEFSVIAKFVEPSKNDIFSLTFDLVDEPLLEASQSEPFLVVSVFRKNVVFVFSLSDSLTNDFIKSLELLEVNGVRDNEVELLEDIRKSCMEKFGWSSICFK